MKNINIPKISSDDRRYHFEVSRKSERSRTPKILHSRGDYVNKVFNFVLSESYMQPHLHPGAEKIEKMYLVQGSFALIIFDSNGSVTDIKILEEDKKNYVAVPAYTWHTYVMLTDEVIIYEEMDGFYSPDTWKEMATWAPKENTPEAITYLNELKAQISAK